MFDNKVEMWKSKMGGILHPTQQINERRIHMLLAVLQAIFKFTLTLGAIFGLLFMMAACTVLVIVCVIRGDIKINIIRSKNRK